MPTATEHWNQVYSARDEQALTWFEAAPDRSESLIRKYATKGDAIIDIGGGASRLVDGLLAAGLGTISVLDLSEKALATSRDRLGPRAEGISWITADITRWFPPQSYALWHDRAVFHFMTTPAQQAAYVSAMAAGLAPGGTAIIATFAEDGPESCSGLPICRYSPKHLVDKLEALAPGQFTPISAERHTHLTPKGSQQHFQISVFRKSPSV